MKKPNVKIWALVGVIVSGLLYLGDFSTFLYRTSVLSFPEHAPFDGTVHPVKQIPNWVSLNGDADDAQFSSLKSSDLVKIPDYDPNLLKRSVDTLTWGNPADDEIRNAKITYSVPYMGSYTLDGLEDAGSHPAVDIKLPYGTPIASIANGVVTKVSMKESGFGHHVVVMHNNVPSFEDANKKVTYYSSYSHLGNVLVNVGEVVTKGQQLALSGNTGTSTTPHLHFQIDNAEAPWHPFWPFTFQEASDAGLNFYSAVNHGLNADKARATTINPVEYVEKYYNASAAPVVESVAAEVVEVVKESPVSEPIVVEAPIIEEEVVVVEEEKEEKPVVVTIVEPSYEQELNFEIEVRSAYYSNDDAEIVVRAIDQKGRQFEGSMPDVVFFKSENKKFVPSKKFIEGSEFGIDAQFEIQLKNLKEGEDRIYVEYGRNKVYSDRFDLVTDAKPKLFTDLDESHKYYEEIAALVDKGVVSGYPDGSFQPDKTVSRVEVLKFILEGIDQKIISGPLPFPDVDREAWYAAYLFTSLDSGYVSGDPAGTYRPGDVVNKAEFYKVLLTAMGVDVNPKISKAPFKDVALSDWFAPYMSLAKSLKITPNVSHINPGTGMTRGEVAFAIYRVVDAAK